MLHDTTPIHNTVISEHAIRECGFTEADHHPYNPDINWSTTNKLKLKYDIHHDSELTR